MMAAKSTNGRHPDRRKRRPSGLQPLARLIGLPTPHSAPPASDVHRIAGSGLFDAAFYRDQIAGNDDWSAASLDSSEGGLIAHYLQHGAAAWLNPSREFDTGLYLQTHPGLATRGGNPLLHLIDSRARSGTGHPDDRRTLRPMPPATARVVANTRRVFVVPATLAKRNTTRYPPHHLAALRGEETPTSVDPAQPPPDLFAEIERGAIVILQRLAFTDENRDLLRRIRASAALLAYDIDDQIFDANELEGWRIRGLQHAPGQYARCIALADHLLVSTEGLRAKIERRFGRPAHVVSNCLGREIIALSEAARQEEQTRVPDGRFVLGYASGSHTHDEDLKVALPAIAGFLRANPKAEFHAIGHMDFPDSLREAFGDRVKHRKAVSWQKLPAVLAGFSAQIVPLVDCPFNRCKSHIRFLEAAAVGVPSIVARVGETGATVIDGVTGLTCPDDPAIWQQAIQTLHDDVALRHRLAESARRFVLANFTTDAPLTRRRTAAVFDEFGLMREET